MAYSVLADVQQQVGGAERLNDLIDWDGEGTADAGVLDSAIADADAEIDGYASKHYMVPFNPVPSRIRNVSAQLAIINIRRSRGMMGPDDHDNYDKLVGENGWLVRLAKGIVTPGGDPLPTKHSTMEPDTATTDAPGDREISRCKLGGFW